MTVSFSVAAETVCALLLLIALGYYAAKVKLIDQNTTKKISAIVIQLAQPFMLFGALTNVEYSPAGLKTGLLTILIGLCSHLIMAVIAFFVAKYRRDPDERKITEFSLIYVNSGFLGFPVLKALLGDIGLFWCSFYVVTFNLAAWSYGILILARGRKDVKINWWKLILNYGSTPCLVGLLFYVLQIRLPAPITTVVKYMDGICTPLVLLVIGANLARIPFKKLFSDRGVYLFSFLRLLVFPTIICLIYHLCGMADDRVMFFTIMACLPTAAIAGMLAEMYNVRPDLAALNVSVSTLFSMFTIPIVVLIANFIIAL